MSAIVINSFLIIIAFCAMAATLNKILHPQERPAHQLLRTIWVLLLALMLTVGLSAATAHTVEKELQLRVGLEQLKLQILQALRAPPPAPGMPKA